MTAEATPAEHRNLVVVGVDGSDPSSEALAWAAEEARLRRATLKVVHAWQIPSVAYVGPAPIVDQSQWVQQAQATLDEQVGKVLGDAPGIDLVTELWEGPSAQAIIDAAADADVLVVGSRGRGGFAGLLLGSVSNQVVHHARCPVVVVPAAR
ncbi:MAG: universal stress protein [Acidimicrobiaceae bacterium]|nr:universal stress protein [Acidimicrobiaceae bacterium]